MKKPFILYHWAPRSIRKKILREGLQPRKPSRCGEWKPPYLCFATSPSFAWALSGHTRGDEEWDLWMCWSSDFTKVTVRSDHRGKHPAEYRTKEGIRKSKLWYVGSRTIKGTKI